MTHDMTFMRSPLSRAWVALGILILALEAHSALALTPAEDETAESPAPDTLPAATHDALAFVSPPASPTDVEIGLYLVGITHVDPPSEGFPGFRAELFMDLRWRDPRLAFEVDPSAPEAERRHVYLHHAAEVELDEIWWPNIEIENEQDARHVESRALVIDSDGTVEYTERFTASLHTEVDLRRFPFDHQTFEVVIESFNWDERSLRFVPYPARIGADERFHTLEWDLRGVRGAVDSSQEMRAPTAFSRFVLAIDLERKPGYYVFKLVLPLLVLVIFTWSAFWMTGEAASARMQRSFVALLTLVAFHQVIAGKLPRISYLTFLDATSMMAFLSIGATLVQIIAVHRAVAAGENERAARLDQVARVAFPLIFALMFAGIWVYFHR